LIFIVIFMHYYLLIATLPGSVFNYK